MSITEPTFPLDAESMAEPLDVASWTPPIEAFPADAPPPPPTPEPPARPARRLIAVALVAGLIGGGVGAAGVSLTTNGAPASSASRIPAPVSLSGPVTGVAAVAASVMPSIVRIDVTLGSNGFGAGGSATGSGVIFTTDGYILTNNHVVDGAQTISVTLSTGQKLTGRLIGTDAPVDDIAVVKIDKTGLPAATLRSTSELNVGDTAVAMGSPFGLQGSVTAGVISALHRNIDLGQGEHLTDAIQTDAPINPGNSGGALADAAGNVVGINTAILGGSGGNVGVGFAIPIDIARRDAQQIIATGHAVRPFLGVSGQNSPAGDGALIDQVVSGGPADRAGLVAGDLVTKVGTTAITSMDALIAVLSTLKSGDEVTLTYVRNGATHTTAATLTSRAT